jgi:hypothetical protein
MGNAGFRALLTRALALSAAEVALFRTLHVQPDGSLVGFKELASQANSKEASEGAVVLVAQVLDLLVAFIGENLTVRLLQQTWPKLTLSDLNSGNGDKK